MSIHIIQWRNQAWRIREQQIEHCLRRVGKGMTTKKDEQLMREMLRNLLIRSQSFN
jgi:hypothetical protein